MDAKNLGKLALGKFPALPPNTAPAFTRMEPVDHLSRNLSLTPQPNLTKLVRRGSRSPIR